MSKPPSQSEESARLAALRRYGVLDTPAEPQFDRVVRMAQQVFQVPIALVSLVDTSRNWFKARVGLDVEELPRDVAFCDHAIRESQVMVVEDARQDPRFRDNPMVVDSPHVRFYAGAPLRTAEGHQLGTLCIIDHGPRTLTPTQQAVLQDLAATVVDALELKRSNQQLAEKVADLEALDERHRDLLARFGQLVEHTPTGIAELNPDGTIRYVNNRWCQILNTTPDRVLGQPWAATVWPEDHPGAVQGALETVLAGGEVVEEFRHIRSDGSAVWVSGTALSLRDEHNAVTGFLGTITDIEGHIHARRDLQESERRYRTLVSGAPIGIFETNVIGECVVVNERWSEITGISDAEARGKSWTLPVHPDDRDEVQARWFDAAIKGRYFAHDFRIQRTDGAVIWVRGRATILPTAETSEDGYIGTLMDITEEHRAHLALRDSEMRLRAVVTGAPLVLYAVDREGVYTLSEGRGLELLGRKPGMAVGQSIFEYRRDSPLILAAVRRALAGEPSITETEFAGHTFEAHHSPTRDEAGNITGALGVAFDITERKAAEKLQAEFTAMVSHELRTPLASILGYADLLVDGDAGAVTPQQHEFLEVISENAQRLTVLINDVLTIEKLAFENHMPAKSPCDLAKVLQAVTRTFAIVAEEKGLQLSLEQDTALPVLGDEDQFNQAFANLVSNAVKYTRAGWVRIRAHNEGDRVIVTVTDSGIGMSPEVQVNLFKRFFRASDQYTRAVGGTGLGLAITKTIVTRYDGTIEVASAQDEGSEFTVSLPRHAQA